jgi:hypothetical protein
MTSHQDFSQIFTVVNKTSARLFNKCLVRKLTPRILFKHSSTLHFFLLPLLTAMFIFFSSSVDLRPGQSRWRANTSTEAIRTLGAAKASTSRGSERYIYVYVPQRFDVIIVRDFVRWWFVGEIFFFTVVFVSSESPYKHTRRHGKTNNGTSY